MGKPVSLNFLFYLAFVEQQSNVQVAKENSSLATLYQGKSLLEQNSVDLALRCLMDDCFTKFRQAIFVNETEMQRFYGLVVNAVIATDIFDAELKASRNERWKSSFEESAANNNTEKGIKDCRATVVIEHLMQASDVVHTMQHWYVFHVASMESFTYHLVTNAIVCSTGTFTESGITSYSPKCIRLTRKVVIPMTQR